MRTIPSMIMAVLLLGATTVAAQETPAQKLENDPGVVQSQQPEPTAQGVRSPEAMPSPTQSTALWQALEDVWRNPTDLQGNPITASASMDQSGPAAATASGCATTEAQLATTPSGSTPCPQAGSDPVPGGGATK